MSIADRIARLESRHRPMRSSPLTAHALERMTMVELGELRALLEAHGDREVEDLPDEPKARVMAIIDAASLRTNPAPIASAERDYDVATWTRKPAVQSGNPASAGAAGHGG